MVSKARVATKPSAIKAIPAGGSDGRLRHSGAFALLAAVMVTVVLPEVLTVVAGTEQVTPTKALETEQVKATVHEKPRIEPTVTVAVVELPAETVVVVGLADIEISAPHCSTML